MHPENGRNRTEFGAASVHEIYHKSNWDLAARNKGLAPWLCGRGSEDVMGEAEHASTDIAELRTHYVMLAVERSFCPKKQILRISARPACGFPSSGRLMPQHFRTKPVLRNASTRQREPKYRRRGRPDWGAGLFTRCFSSVPQLRSNGLPRAQAGARPPRALWKGLRPFAPSLTNRPGSASAASMRSISPCRRATSRSPFSIACLSGFNCRRRSAASRRCVTLDCVFASRPAVSVAPVADKRGACQSSRSPS